MKKLLLLLLIPTITTPSAANPRKRKADSEESTALVTKADVLKAKALHKAIVNNVADVQWTKIHGTLQEAATNWPKDLTILIAAYYLPKYIPWTFDGVLQTGYIPPVALADLPRGPARDWDKIDMYTIDISGLGLEEWAGFCERYQDIWDKVFSVDMRDNELDRVPHCEASNLKHVFLSPQLAYIQLTNNRFSNTRTIEQAFRAWRQANNLQSVVQFVSNGQKVHDWANGAPYHEYEQA